MLREGRHQLGVADLWGLAKVGGLQGLFGRGPLAGVVHEEEVEEAETGRAQPGEFVFQVVVRLVLQGEVLKWIRKNYKWYLNM